MDIDDWLLKWDPIRRDVVRCEKLESQLFGFLTKHLPGNFVNLDTLYPALLKKFKTDDILFLHSVMQLTKVYGQLSDENDRTLFFSSTKIITPLQSHCFL